LIYYFEKEDLLETPHESIPFTRRTFVIVELKYRTLAPKDLAQISRYMSALKEKMLQECPSEYMVDVEGLFVSFGQDESMQEITINFDFDDIHFLNVEENITFKPEHWTHKTEYIKKLKLDERIEKLGWGE
jgi:hypothetical protein